MPRGGPPQRPGEPDLLAERRARRAVESGEGALLRRAEAAEATVHTLETHISSLQQRLQEAEGDRLRTLQLTERLERVETALQTIRESHRRMASTIGELKDVTVRLRSLADMQPASEPVERGRDDMATALAAAVERLRARAEELPPLSSAADRLDAQSTQVAAPGAPTPPADPSTVMGESASPAAAESAQARPSHKHSMSLLARLRAARSANRKHRNKDA
jgi:chaperonin cofactor prefoldin